MKDKENYYTTQLSSLLKIEKDDGEGFTKIKRFPVYHTSG